MAELFDILTHYGAKTQDLVMTEVYADIANFTTPDLPVGKYSINMSITYKLSVANKSAFLRFTTDGGIIWTEFTAEPKDATDDVPAVYNYYKENFSGVKNMIIQMRKEDANGVLTVHFADAWIQRIG